MLLRCRTNSTTSLQEKLHHVRETKLTYVNNSTIAGTNPQIYTELLKIYREERLLNSLDLA
jgi:hypothetical protein